MKKLLFIIMFFVFCPVFIYSDVLEDSPVNLTIAGSATDIDNDPLIYRIMEKITLGTNWLIMGQDGSISGTPTNEDVGENKWRIRVEDDEGAFDEAELVINVLNVNDPPKLVFPTTITISQRHFINIDLMKYIVDIDPTSDTVIATIISGPEWISLNSGKLSGMPGDSNIGINNVKLKVEDNHGDFTEFEMYIVVKENFFNEIFIYKRLV